MSANKKTTHPTIEDVARRAGTSPSTVSRLLNQSGYVSEQTQRRIEQAISELNYEPSRMARQMKGKPSRLVGLILPYIDTTDFAAYTQAVAEALRPRGYDVVLCVNNENPEIDLRHLINLRNQKVDGILYCHPARGTNSSFVRRLAQDGVPVVEVMRHRELEHLYAVISDEERAAQRLSEHLLSKGHRRIGFIAGWPNMSSTRYHLAGYQRALREAHIPMDADLIRARASESAHGRESADALLNLSDPPTALICVGERVLFGALSGLHSRGLRIPDDISLVSTSPAEWLRIWNPPITIAGTPVSTLAYAAVDVLLRCIESPENTVKPVTHFLDAPMFQGGSVKPL